MADTAPQAQPTDNRIAAHPTLYQSTLFRSRLEARWAAFFDLIGYKWKYEPIDFSDWVPDFQVSFPCRHSECRPWCRHEDCVSRYNMWLQRAADTWHYSYQPSTSAPCDLQEGEHSFYAEVKPYHSLAQFKEHPVTKNDFGQHYGLDGGMARGLDPSIASAAFSHGAGGGWWTGHDLFGWVKGADFDAMWQQAGNLTRWHPSPRTPCLMPGCPEPAIAIADWAYCERHTRERHCPQCGSNSHIVQDGNGEWCLECHVRVSGEW